MHAVVHALSIAGSMTWQIAWALILGFALSAVVQAVVRRSTIVRLLGDDRPRTLALATAFGTASSSCSYAAVALARALFRRGASFTAAMVFEIASTNLVIELGVILALLMGWQFTLAEFTGGPVMIVVLAVAFRLFLREKLVREARQQADRGVAGSMEGHAAMDMSVQGSGSFARRLLSQDGYTAVANVFVMEWAAILRDLVIGLLAAGAIAAWVPDSFWQAFFFAGHPLAAKLWGPIIGPAVAILSFVCSVGNVPLAVVLWKGGISFGGVVAFIFADLIILPILNIYRKYYGAKMAAFILATFYATMVIAGYVIELVFGGLGLIPGRATAKIPDQGVAWDYTTWLNIGFGLLAAALIVRFLRTGGLRMLRMMNGDPDGGHEGHDHAAHGTGGHDHHQHSAHGGHTHHGQSPAEALRGRPGGPLPDGNRRAPGPVTAAGHRRAMKRTPSTGPGRILVVERDPAVALFAETVLGVWENFEVTSVASAGAAAELLERESWDLVLADFELPDAQALRLLAAVRQEAPALPFAMMTAFPVLEPAATAIRAADGFVTKPMKPSHLIGLATDLIENARRLRNQADC